MARPRAVYGPLPLLLLACTLGPVAAGAAGALEPEDSVNPEIVIPGEWLTNEADTFLLLTLKVPNDIRMDQCKVMSNGESLLVVVTEDPKDEPETDAMRKYKLVVEAIKSEVGHDEKLLRSKLDTWLQTEEDDEVRVHVQAALESLDHVSTAKAAGVDAGRTISVPLGLPASRKVFGAGAAASAVMLQKAPPAVGTASLLARRRENRAGIIKESFAVEIPFPVDSEQIFVLRSSTTRLVVAMPLKRNSLEARGISTGGKPFARLPVFSPGGQLLAGPRGSKLAQLSQGLRIPSVVAQAGLRPLRSNR